MVTDVAIFVSIEVFEKVGELLGREVLGVSLCELVLVDLGQVWRPRDAGALEFGDVGVH